MVQRIGETRPIAANDNDSNPGESRTPGAGAAFVHRAALVETSEIGEGTNIWAFSHVLRGAVIGRNCNIGDHGYVEAGAVIGNNVTVKNHVCVWEGITIEDDVFVGPYVSFTNDLYPRSARMPEAEARGASKAWLVKTIVEKGCSIGANATILAGVRLGRYSLIAAGAVVTKDVEPFAQVVGSPARKVGYVCRCGGKLGAFPPNPAVCPHCGARHDIQEAG